MANARLLRIAAILFCVIGGSFALPKSELFPFGREQYLPAEDDVSSPEVPLTVPIIFYGNEYRTIYVNDNGLLSFLTEVPSFFNAQFPLTYPIISPLYSDIDTRAAGRIYYRETQDNALLERAARDIRSHFSHAGSFHPRSLFIATWDEVGYYERATDKLNTFQVVIASDGEDSYVYFLYPSNGVQWIQSQGKNPNLPDARAQAGFMSGDGRLYTVRGSGTDQARNFDRMSNAKKAGMWLFHVGRPTSTERNVMPPDMESTDGSDDRTSGQTAATCSDTLLPCPPHSTCVDNQDGKGFCCICKDNYFGNGRNCVEKNSPQRMNGKVSGSINDIQLQDADLHAYIVTEDGRTYTAVSRVPPGIGSDLQVLTPLGGIVGWLFAVSRSDAPNGFTITGGAFNRTVEVDFPQTGHHVYIEESFLGPDVFNYMRVQVRLRGSVPSVPVGSKIEVPDYEEEYTRVSPGTIRSRASRSYRLEGNNLEVPFTLDQTITYSECNTHMTSTRLKVARNFIVYDPQEQIVRYAMTNKISPLTGDDPCKEGRQVCGPNSNCVVEGDSFRCVCNQGYQQIYEEAGDGSTTCVDVNECLLGRDNCHVHADCLNLPGSFTCRCQSGYFGDGTNCERKQTCADINCDPNADCTEGTLQRPPQCRCRIGYLGNGQTCEPAESDDCRSVNYCDRRADCIYDEETHRHTCKCRRGFTGDGVVCVEDSCDVAENCSPDGSCLYDAEGEAYYCACRPGFSGDGYVCLPEETFQSCDVVNNCHPQAQCIYDAQIQRYNCQCNPGYRGDGKTCNRVVEELTCDQANICSPYALCVRDEVTGRHVCQCNAGFDGDGLTCTPLDECNSPDDCDTNAECLYDSEGQRFHCQCLPGFRGRGTKGMCSLDPDVSCNVRNNCHESATCSYDFVDLTYRCQCKPGFNGDGYRCEKAEVPCNIINSCHVKAECQYDSPTRGYKCRCLPGYDGDGHECRSLRSCREDRYLCDRNAECVPYDATGDYVCRCHQGFIGDGSTCTPAPQHSGGYLVFAHGMSLLRVPTLPTKSNPGQLLLMEPNQTPVGLTTDCQMGHLYWADASLKVIRRANYNGSDVTMTISNGMVSPEGVAVDWLGRNIYWTDSGNDTIEVASLTTKYRKVLISEGLSNPRGIAVHPGLGKMYWTDWNRNSPKIETANMDGTGRTELVKDNLGLPNMLVIDYDRNNLCWTDSGLRRIECIALNGQSRRVVYTPAVYPFGIAIHEGFIYWTDWEIKFLHRVDVNGGEAEPLEIPAGGSGKMYGIVSLPSYCPSVTSYCAVENGGCKYLCLPTGRGGRSCVCPDSSEDGTEELECSVS
ncbi:Nidogen-1 [Araneus ventricosus]|uniref:Nidogen-1 n=1 Tax=Araneus ventricosus TaxID=182803 RepID=A0A4Y2BNP9_ARAVE|nr:Nidogen-1 [Araneus ventricosus]